MIDRIDLQTAAESAVRPRAAAAQQGGKTFADTLRETTRARSTGGAAPANTPLPKAELGAPAGEQWRPVAGEANYAEIISGPRAGQFINLTRGERRGETFTIEETDGKKFHVYGSGDDALRVEIKPNEATRAGQGVTIPKNERWEMVEGHNFRADILNGRRNGWFVNISGGVRHGQAFHIVEKNDKTFHVYGHGKDRLWVEIRPKADATDPAASTDESAGATDAPATTEQTPASGSTGGTAAGS